MYWLIAYLIGVIFVPGLYWIFFIYERGEQDTYVKIANTDQMCIEVLTSLAWPIHLPLDFVRRMRKAYLRKVVEVASNILYSHFRDREAHDRSFLIDIAETKLKFLLQAHRKKHIKLSAQQVDMIRNELMSRNMERSLLK